MERSKMHASNSHLKKHSATLVLLMNRDLREEALSRDVLLSAIKGIFLGKDKQWSYGVTDSLY